MFLRRLRELLHQRRLDQELAEEVESHLAMASEDHRRRGLSPEEARYAALRSFGGLEQMKEAHRDRRGWPFLDALLQDLRYAARTLAKSPGFTAAAALTMALGVGVNTALFSMFHLLDRPLPLRNPGTVVQLDSTEHAPISWREYLHLRRHVTTLSGLAAGLPWAFVAESPDPAALPVMITGEFVSDNLLALFEGDVLLGRHFLPEEAATPMDGSVTILSYALWQSRYGGDRRIVGRTIRLNGIPLTVIGVTAPGFVRAGIVRGVWNADLWVPLTMFGRFRQDTEGASSGREWYERFDARLFSAYGRLRPGRTTEQARAEVNALLHGLELDYPAFLAKARTIIPVRLLPRPAEPLPGKGAGPGLSGVPALMRVVLAASSMVLLIACANIATLLLARGAARRREIAVRLCLGASRARVIRQLLTESVLLAGLGGAAGLLLSWWSLHTFLAAGLLSALGQSALTSLALLHMAPDRWVLAYTLVLSVASAIFFGLAPAWQATRIGLATAAKGGENIRRSGLSKILVVGQVALSLVLLIGAGLLLRGLIKAQSGDASFDPKKLMVLRFATRSARYDEARVQQFHRGLAERLRALSGVVAVTRAQSLPGDERDDAWLKGDRAAPALRLRFSHNSVLPNYFEALGIPILAGRTFTEAERRGAAPVMLVSQSLAARLWPHQNPLGKTVWFRSPLAWALVVGVTADVRNVLGETRPTFYFPLLPNREREGDGRVLVRTAGEAAASLAAVRAAAHAVDPALHLTAHTVPGYVAEMDRVRSTRTASALAASLGALALLLAAVGLYGVMAYSVTQRRHEIGIRMALGAARGVVLRAMLAAGLRLVAVGVALGALGGVAASRLLTSLLFGVSPFDPLAHLGVSAFLLAVAAAAIYAPARQAASVDPMEALRYE
jgi:putative ABC transport system permease protein